MMVKSLFSALKISVVALSVLLTSTLARADIKIGATLAETGPASFLGAPEAKTLKLLVDQLNARGGVNGEKIDLVLYDDGGDPNKARTFATRLVEDDEVVAVIGGSTTGTTLAAAQVFEDAEVPFISLAGALKIIEPVKPFTFKTPHTDRMACAKIFTDMKARGITRIGMISGTDGFGASMRGQCLGLVADYGIEVVADESYGPKDVDMTPQLTNIRNADGLQAVLNPGFGQGPAVVTRNYDQLGIEVPLYQSHGVASDGFITLAGEDAAEGVRLPGTALLVGEDLPDGDRQKPVVMSYKSLYESETGEPVSTFGGYAHDAFQILVDALKRSDVTDPVSIRDEIRKTSNLIGTTGVVNMSETDHLGLKLDSFLMLEIKDGSWVVVE